MVRIRWDESAREAPMSGHEPDDGHDRRSDDELDGGEPLRGDPPSGRGAKLVAAVAPRGPWQIVLALGALCFLAGSVGFLVGTRQSPVPTSAVDVGFLVDMSDHHDQAVGMALCTVNRAEEPLVQSMAREILVFQNRELARMASLLEQMRAERPESEGRTAMTWMGMPTPVESMPGMASAEDYARLCSATGRDVDRFFLLLMRAHHVGGLHMTDVAAKDAVSPSVRSLATTMARNQRIEVNEYTAAMERLGLGR
jgi:uncharacterized protein (DUF305 family)